MNTLTTNKRVQVIAALVEGTSINSTSRITGVAKHTILKLLKNLGCAAASYHDSRVRNLQVRRVQCDEIWAFVYAKRKNVTLEQMQQGAGDVWTWTAIDADTKLIISYMLGDRGATTAQAFMKDVAERVTNRFQLTTDGHRVYADAVEDAFGSEIDYAMLVKIYGASNDSPESRYSPATCIGCRTGVLAGSPDSKHISTSFVERQNLSMRMGMRRFTRLTNGFSKKLENHGHAVALYFMHYNFCRVHKTLRVTPGGWPTLSQRALPQLRLPQPLRFSKAGDFYCRHRKCLPCTTLHLSTSLFVHQHQPAFAISIRPEAAPSSDFVNCGSYGQAEDRERRKTTADSAHISRTIPRQSRATVAFRPVLAKDCYFYQFLKSEKMRDGGVPQIRRKGLSEPRLGVLVLTLTGVLACPITRLT